MKEITLNIFEFQELPLEIQNKAIDAYREILIEDKWWYDIVIHSFKERLTKLGYWDIDCFFSGFYSQGDGASFVAKYGYEKISEPDEFGERLNKLQEKYNHDLRGRIIKTSSNYDHENTMTVNYLESDYLDVEEEDINEVKTISRELARILYVDLEKEYDYLTSNNTIVQYFVENETYFYKNGKIYEDL